ncbi:MAG: NADH-quinone oxidoreductase subunit NuoG [Burkholderiaceae bacterium]|jgi:NADH-quinone oxidoreductase subunit G|nr:NADH-quinone oxidoreductase subunit NuoG [Burkholderiaceae bacterium]
MVEVEIDGKKIEVLEGSMVMDAAAKLDIYVPHFCYHKKLSIAANCRMCLVEVEKAPKPLPACATPVTQGMVVRTASDKAKLAQKGVMEFLLINHPLDCPICDQGGECQLQDLAVGYGGSSSRYDEAKRVVFHKGLGPLISAEEMTRCIHCTRCVRFGQEIAGQMELGMAGRGEHSEILSFIDKTVDHELSGNMIDLCPVGALTSKPFRYAARTWELSRRKSVAGHDALGSNLIVQVKNHRVLRVLPLENEPVNECWLSDRDRFSYEGLYAADRLSKPMLKQGGQWKEVDWADAIDYVAHALSHVKTEHGAASIGALASPNSTLEELFLLGRLMRGLGSENIDHRLRQTDFSADGRRRGAPWLGMAVEQINQLDRLLLVGSFLRKDHPLVAARVRAAVKRGCQVSVVHATDDDLLMPLASKAIVAPSAWAQALAEIAAAVAEAKNLQVPVAGVAAGEDAKRIAASLASGERAAVLLGNAALQSPQAAQIQALAQWIAQATGAVFGVLGEGANSVGAHAVGAVPAQGGLNARTMLEQRRRAYLLWNFEPEYDTANPALTLGALAAADTVIAFSAYRNGALEYADAILPIAPFLETSGTFVNFEGRVQTFNGAVRPHGESRPGWKVLRVLGTQLGLADFEFDTPDAVRAALPQIGPEALDGRIDLAPQAPAPAAAGALQRVADVPIYFTDPIVRRAESLQMTADARPPRLSANAATLAQLNLKPGDKARAKQWVDGKEAAALLEVALDDGVADGTVRVPAGHAATSTLGPMFGAISVERA